jgi:hypothetical protein
VAVRARVRVVRVFMTLDASFRCRKMQWAGLSSVPDASVTFETVDPLEDVCAMLERPVLLLLLEPKHLRARSR